MDKRIIMSAVLYGLGVKKAITRKWYNPMRWFRGKTKIVNISIKNIFKT